MENSKRIELREQRDFSKKMNATFEFVKQHFKPLGKAILFIAGPAILLVSIATGSMMSDMFANLSSIGNTPGGENNFFTPTFIIQWMFTIVFGVVCTVMLLSTTINYMKIYEEKRDGSIEVHEVWERVRKTFLMYLGTFFGYGVLAIAVTLLLTLPVIGITQVSPFLTFLGILALLVLVVYLSVKSSLIFFVRGFEGLGFFPAMLRSFRLVKGKWWSTFGILFALSTLAGIISYIFIIPWYVVTFINAFHSLETGVYQSPSTGNQIISILFFSIYYLSYILLYSLPLVGLGFQYFNLVELKEAKGLMETIESFGQAPPAPSVPDEHY